LLFITGIQAGLYRQRAIRKQRARACQGGPGDEKFSAKSIPARASEKIEGSRGGVGSRPPRPGPLVSRETVHGRTSAESKAKGIFKFFQIRGVQPTAYEIHDHSEDSSKDACFKPNQSEIMNRPGRFQKRSRKPRSGRQPSTSGRKVWARTAGVFESQSLVAGIGSVVRTLSEIDEPSFRREGLCSTIVLEDRQPPKPRAKLAEQFGPPGRTTQCTASDGGRGGITPRQAENTEIMKTGGRWSSPLGSWGLGAVFGIMNTMFAAHRAQRAEGHRRVLRIIGFKPYENRDLFSCWESALA